MRVFRWCSWFLDYLGGNAAAMLWLIGFGLYFTYDGTWRSLGATLESIAVLLLATGQLKIARRLQRIETEGIKVRLGVELVDGGLPRSHGLGLSPEPPRKAN
jgi:hypothetical protein